ncbi:MAG: penicillin-binding protein 2 [Flavobacteriaceae bacterium]
MRKYLFLLIVISTGILISARLFYLQVYDTSAQISSQNNAIKKIYDFPQRGFIFDRNRKLLVSNQPSYDVMVIPKNTEALNPNLKQEFCDLLKITLEDYDRILEKAIAYSPRLPSVVVPQFTKDEYAYLSEKMWKYKGFYIQKRALRDYQVSNSANVFGYIAEVNQSIIKKNPYYLMGDLIGKSGIEMEYEEVLRGEKGVKYLQMDRFNRKIGPYKEGIYDTIPINGKDITLTIDAVLQEYGERLLINKRGGIVALEPTTGEILALITAPNYDPKLLVGRERSKNFTKLWYDTISRPLFDRVLQGEYPPGSPFKSLTALIGMQEGVINSSEKISCYNGYNYGGKKMLGCHPHDTPLTMIGGIANSCNSYFCTIYKRSIEKYPSPQEGIDNWKKHLESFGLGNYIGYDLPPGKKGLIPSSEFYNRWYKYPKYKWYATATISNAIGQGEVILTPMQMVNFTAAIANKGWYYKPHILKKISNIDTISSKYTKRYNTTIDAQYFEPVIEGMFDVYNEGTAKYIQIPGIEICGKTGTAENFTKIDGKRVQLTDHSIFIAFAPKDNPKIAIAVIVENGYWGSRWAGRIAGLMIEKYLKGKITRKDMEAYVLNGSLLEEYEKPYSGKTFNINY